MSRAEALKKWEEYVEKILYSDKYSDDFYEYRHVTLPKPLLKMVPKTYLSQDGSGVLRLLSDEEWRSIGIQQSPGWEHYEVHAPEPHVLLFRRPLNYVAPQQAGRQAQKATRK
ncbi:cyclin-dependent kinase regulatory subunit [Schizopora paradoxa]|uniref:Cyclin-dependent kinases regulatory subunit n=1 Tax=Schizopora paradoxa TaxID=27342 RepID=A0A0H2S4H9_9AGAM|nr:cyclin-dependent kinase regulatory subunit [Schizopora paradoxa]